MLNYTQYIDNSRDNDYNICINSKDVILMFSNIGKKIKVLAEVLALIGIVVSIIWGFSIIITNSDSSTKFNNDYFLPGIKIIVIGSLLSWIGSFALYGFGALIESVQHIENNICGNSVNETSKEYFCSACKSRIYPENTHCLKCGRKIEWQESTRN